MNKKTLDVILICGVNYGGKSTLSSALVKAYPEFVTESISATTRQPRQKTDFAEAEIDGTHYYFVKENVFEEQDFIEYEKFVDEKGNPTYYGTPTSELIRAYTEDKILAIVLEAKGMNNVYRNIHSFEYEGQTIELRKTAVLLNIAKKNVYKRLNEQVDREKFPEIYEKEVGRIERGNIPKLIKELGIEQYADVKRDRYFIEGYVKDIVNAVPRLLCCENSKKKGLNQNLGEKSNFHNY